MGTYSTEQEAQDKLNMLSEEFGNKICPVFKDKCKLEECHSFYKGRIIKTNEFGIHTGEKSKGFVTTPVECTCSIVTGFVAMEE